MAEIESLAQVITDLGQQEARIDKTGYLDAKRLAKEVVFPFFRQLTEAVDEEVAELREAVESIIEQEGSMLAPEVAAKLLGTFEIGRQLCEMVKSVMTAGEINDIHRKQLEDLVGTYERNYDESTKLIAEFTVIDEGEEEEPTAPEAPETGGGSDAEDDAG